MTHEPPLPVTQRFYTFLRYFVAAVVFWYGFAKLTGAQFTMLESELDKPLRDVSGFWLVWYFFGYSAIYGNFVALVQVAAGVLLLFRRTTLLGAAVLFGVLSNIVLVDIFYGVDLGALLAAVVLTGCLAFILWQHRAELIDLFWSRQNAVYADAPPHRTPPAVRYAVRLALVAVALGGTYWIANYNNRAPTPLDGRWAVESARGIGGEVPTTFYFERNRARMAVLRYGDDWQRRHFEVDPETNQIGIWSEWLSKGDPVFSGRYGLDGDLLTLSGDWGGADAEVVLRRVPTAP